MQPPKIFNFHVIFYTIPVLFVILEESFIMKQLLPALSIEEMLGWSKVFSINVNTYTISHLLRNK